MLADCLSGKTGTVKSLEGKAKTIITNELKQAPITTTLDWGPAVFQATDLGSKVADNTMFVAHFDMFLPGQGFPTGDNYFVAIAGTNYKSLWGWLVEDFGVWDTTPWEDGNPSAGKISTGSFLGRDILLGLPSSTTNPQTLVQYLKSAIGPSKKATVFVTGHSLGGTLAPLVALALEETKDQWGGPKATVQCYPFAGPTPGDQTFVDYYNSKGIKTWRTWNRYDVAPHVWDEAQMAKIANLYGGFPTKGRVKKGWAIETVVQFFEDLAAGKNYKHLGTSKPFSNDPKNNPKAYADVDQPACTSNLEKFALQAIYQHTYAYILYFAPKKLPAKPITCKDLNKLVSAEALEAVVQQGAVNLNTATASELERLPRIGPKLAARILRHRAIHDPFQRVEDLVQVHGIGAKTLALLAPCLVVEELELEHA